MPSRAEDRFFGAKRGSSARAFEEMVKTYGYARAMRVYHGLLNDRKKAGKTYGRHK